MKPAPTSGTIVIRKEVEAAAGVSETFDFGGSVSYERGGAFAVGVEDGEPAEERFYRAAAGSGEPWRVREIEAVDWRLADLSCVSRDGASTAETSVADLEAAIALVAGDLVTCTFVDAEIQPSRGLELRKVSDGAVGRFTYTVTPGAGGESRTAVARTEEEGVAVDADPAPLGLPAGTYEVSEVLPSSNRGKWQLRSVECEGTQKEPSAQTIEVTVPARGGRACTFRNVFLPRGSITISKVTVGGVGTSSFLIATSGEEPEVFKQTATTTEVGVAARARGDSTARLRLGRYAIVDSPPAAAGEGERVLRYVQCDGRAIPFDQGRVEIALTVANPHRSCTFVNALEPQREPLGPGPRSPSPRAKLRIVKRPARQTVKVGEVLTYRIEVTNVGEDPAVGVHVVDQPKGPFALVSARAESGDCNRRLPLVCWINTIRPGEAKTVTVRMRILRPGRYLNRAVAGTATDAATGAARGEAKAEGRLPVFEGLG